MYFCLSFCFLPSTHIYTRTLFVSLSVYISLSVLSLSPFRSFSLLISLSFYLTLYVLSLCPSLSRSLSLYLSLSFSLYCPYSSISVLSLCPFRSLSFSLFMISLSMFPRHLRAQCNRDTARAQSIGLSLCDDPQLKRICQQTFLSRPSSPSK